MLVLFARVVLVGAIAATSWPAAGGQPNGALADRVGRLTRAAQWTRINAIPVRFKTFHPQGMVKIGDRFFVTSVEVHDREAGKGIGHLFQFDLSGKLIADLTLGEGAMYHPGGIDYDGRHIWVTVAEYRPNSRSIVYRVDPKAMTAQEMFRFTDHLGAIVHDTEEGSLHAVNWGSRTFYRWELGADGRVAVPATPQQAQNASHYVDYQDCKFAGGRTMACTGVAEIRPSPDERPLRLGGIELVDLRDHRPIHQVPIALWIRGRAMTQNPTWFEPVVGGLRAYFMPEDDDSTIYVYEAR
jgi:Family of unknown function (DUF6454)